MVPDGSDWCCPYHISDHCKARHCCWVLNAPFPFQRMISEQDNLPGNTQVMDRAGIVNQKALSGNVVRNCLKYWNFNAKLCWLPRPSCCHWCTGIRLGYPKCSGLAGKSLNLAPCNDNRLLIHHLRPQNVAKGRLCIILQHSSSSCFLISHPLLCKWFSWNFPRMEMAGYNFDFAFLPSRVYVGNAEMFPWLSHLGHALGEILGKFCVSNWKSEL